MTGIPKVLKYNILTFMQSKITKNGFPIPYNTFAHVNICIKVIKGSDGDLKYNRSRGPKKHPKTKCSKIDKI